MPSVKIGREFFANAKRDYSNWVWAWVRELAQNSIDAPHTRNVKITVTDAPEGNTLAVWENDGQPMTEEVLVNKFLALGASGKQCQDGAVGGFGKAKEVIAFAHLSWVIETGSVRAIGYGGEYELTTVPVAIHGTRTTIVMEGDQKEKVRSAVRKFAECCRWNGQLTLNGEVLKTSNPNGAKRADFDRFGRECSADIRYGNDSSMHGPFVKVTEYDEVEGTIEAEPTTEDLALVKSVAEAADEAGWKAAGETVWNG